MHANDAQSALSARFPHRNQTDFSLFRIRELEGCQQIESVQSDAYIDFTRNQTEVESLFFLKIKCSECPCVHWKFNFLEIATHTWRGAP
jgi:hypothetical protein